MGISKDLTEEDIKFRYINEAITSKGWSKDSIFMEQKVKFTDGKINLHGNLVHREKPKFADYFKKRKALDHEIDKTLAEIQRILGINVNVDEL